MRSNPQQRDPVYLMGRRLLMIVGFILVITAITNVWKLYQKERESAALRNQAEMRLADLQKRYDQLSAAIATMKTERGKEEVLREQYELGKEGEKLIIIVDPSTPTPVQATTSRFEWVRKAFKWW